MKIKRRTQNQVEVELGGQLITVVFHNGKDLPTLPTQGIVVCGLPHGAARMQNLVSGPGEYELAGIQIVAVEAKSEPDGSADVLRFTDGRESILCVLGADVDMPQASWEAIGEIDVLLMNLQNAPQEPEKFIHKVSPYVLAVCGDKQEVEKRTGIKLEAEVPQLKLTEKDFVGEDASTKMFLLS